jgi:nicotinamidase-related amidase
MRALIVVDMQNGCFAVDPPRRGREDLVERINAMSRAMRERDLVVFIQHCEPGGFEHGTEGWRLLPELDVASEDEIVEKAACDAFLETSLKALLDRNGIGEVVVVGCATDFCVDTTVRSAASHGFDVTVVTDGHTTCDRPHLPARSIIEHHNYMWRNLVLPRGRTIRMVSAAELLAT